MATPPIIARTARRPAALLGLGRAASAHARRVLLWIARIAGAVLLVFATILLVRAFDARRGAPLEPWHRWAPPSEATAATIAREGWGGTVAREGRVFGELDAWARASVPASARVASNRYNPDGPLWPGRFARDWNRSYEMAPPAGVAPRGAALLLHGLTDSPYSLRALAGVLANDGWRVVVPRLPGHGTTPGGLEHATWRDWRAATRVAAAHARAVAPGGAFVVVGYSNGGALALDLALDAVTGAHDDAAAAPPRVDRVVLISPMLDVGTMARLAPWIRRLGAIPFFERSRWIDVLPEYNPFKYTSFPAHAAEQSDLLSRRVRDRVARASATERAAMPPTLLLQSVVDDTVRTDAVVPLLEALGARSELVLFDVNRLADVRPFFAPGVADRAAALLAGTHAFRTTVVTNAGDGTAEVVARTTTPAGGATAERPLGLAWPFGVYSLSHVALPFPADDPLWGIEAANPEGPAAFGLRLGRLAPRGERAVLEVPVANLMRLGCNPFFPYVAERTSRWAAGGP